jgi:Na+/melibiose symporter-like transporter
MQSFDAAIQVFYGLWTLSATAWAVSGGLTLVAFVAMHTAFPVKSLATIYAPVLFLGGLSGIYVCQRNGLYFTSDEASNAVIAATAGLVVALFAAVVVTRLVYAVTRLAAPEDTSGGFMRSVEPRRTGIRPARTSLAPKSLD